MTTQGGIIFKSPCELKDHDVKPCTTNGLSFGSSAISLHKISRFPSSSSPRVRCCRCILL